MSQENQIKLNDILSTESCNVKGFLERMGFESEKGKAYAISVALRNFLFEFDYTNGDLLEIKKLIEPKIDSNVFISNSEKEAELDVLYQQLARYLKYERALKREIIQKNVFGSVKIGSHEIQVSGDIVFNNGDTIEIVKYKRGAPKLSYRGQKFDTKPQNSIELYLLQKMCENNFKHLKKPVVASLYSMKNKDDKGSELVEEFNNSKGKNIISMHFANMSEASSLEITQLEDMEKRILDLITREVSLNSEKTCDKSKCDMCQFSKICHYDDTIQQELEPVEEIKNSSTPVRFTEGQRRLLEHRIGFLRVNAGAGSGKTSTIVNRCLELIKKGCQPEDLLLITFTNKGCQELKERFTYWAKVKKIEVDPSKIKIFTFNGFGEEIINKEYSRLGFVENPKLAGKVERYDIILKLLDTREKIEGLDYRNPLMDLPFAKGCVVEVNNYFNKLKSKDYKTFQDFAKDVGISEAKAEGIWRMYQLFCEELVLNNLIQYQDQINYALELFRAYPDIIEAYSVKHIMVDEFQDTDEVQMEFIKILVKRWKFESLVVVGDDSQSIFSFRDVSSENILNFHETYKSSKDIFLVDNFRSTPEIIYTANRLIARNKRRLEKDLIARKDSGDKPKIFHYKSEDDEYSGITENIEKQISNGVEPNEIAVIARTKNELLEISSYLKSKNIPVIIETTELLLNNKNVQMILSFANFFENPSMDLNLLEYLMMFKKNEIKNMNTNQIKGYLDKTRHRFILGVSEMKTDEEKLDYFFKCIEPIAKKDKNVEEFIQQLKDKNFKSYDELISYLKKFALYEDEKTISKSDTKYKAVVLTTVHSSKGKEFEFVYITLNKFKYKGSRMTEYDLEEERRLLFVATTRAKDKLFYTYSTKGTFGFPEELDGVEWIEST